jgi:hypothetical protein
MEDAGAIVRASDAGGIDVDVLAATLRASSSDLGVFVEVLAEKLEQALPGRVQVERRSTRFLGKEKRVGRIQCQLGDVRYVLAARGGVPETSRATAVRGVVLKTEPLPLSGWLDALARDLAHEAQTSELARVTLQQLLAE